MAKQQPHEKVINMLMGQIFSTKLAPGTKLPPERELAEDLGTNRTSLRVALKQLQSMQVLDIRRSDGIYVKDYMKNAGIDFLRLLFSQPESDKNSINIDMYLIDEVWEWWIATFPEILELASKRYSPRDLRTLMEMSDKELECIDDRQEIVRLEIAEEDLVVKLANNTVFLLISNSSRPLRKKMIEIFVESIDQKTLIKHIEDRKILLKKLMTGPKEDVPISINAYRKDLAGNRDIVRKYLIKKYPI